MHEPSSLHVMVASELLYVPVAEPRGPWLVDHAHSLHRRRETPELSKTQSRESQTPPPQGGHHRLVMGN